MSAKDWLISAGIVLGVYAWAHFTIYRANKQMACYDFHKISCSQYNKTDVECLTFLWKKCGGQPK